MPMRRMISLTVALALTAALLGVPTRSQADAGIPTVSARGAILIEASSGRVLMEKNADAALEPASTTKIMTALLAIESGMLDRIVTVSDRAAGTEGSSLYLKTGETLPLLELVYGLMLQSGNDAAIAIAEAVEGNVEAFVERMNAKADLLGLRQTHFENPNGLHAAGHHTTARELCAIATAAMQNPIFREVVATQSRTAKNCSAPHTFRNKNKFLTQYEGCNGVKTGYTKAAGKCLVFAAQRNGMQLIGVILNAPNMWDDARALLDYGFSTYELQRPVSSEEISSIQIENGESSSLPVCAKYDILYPIRSDGSESLTVSKQLAESFPAPIKAGDALGEIRVFINGTLLTTVPIVAMESVPAKSFRSRWIELLERW